MQKGERNTTIYEKIYLGCCPNHHSLSNELAQTIKPNKDTQDTSNSLQTQMKKKRLK